MAARCEEAALEERAAHLGEGLELVAGQAYPPPRAGTRKSNVDMQGLPCKSFSMARRGEGNAERS